MPIYEFFCSDCNTIFNFFSARVNTEKRPLCPKCGKGPIGRLVSRVSVLRGLKESDDMGMPDLDESKIEKAMSLLEREAQGINDEDPRQAARLMRKLCDATGLDLGSGMEEAIRRMEAGEDPDRIEAEMGDLLEGEDMPFRQRKIAAKGRRKAPLRDETLYTL